MSPRLIEPDASSSPVLALLMGSGLILLHEDGIEVVVEALWGVFGDALRCGGALGVLGRGVQVSVIAQVILGQGPYFHRFFSR